MRKKLLKTDMTALAGIACGALVGGIATAALAAERNDHRPQDLEVHADCAVEGTTPRIVVTGGSESRVVVAPNVRVGVGSSCADGREIHVTMRDHDSDMRVRVHRLEMDEDARERIERARERMERAQERIERARERSEQARERALEARERAEAARERMDRIDWDEVELREAATADALRSAERILQNRLRMLEEDGVEELDQARERLVDIEARLADDLDDEIREELTREMRRLRVELDRALAESRGAGN